MDVIFISTTDMKGGRGAVLDRMLQSLFKSQADMANDRILLMLLLQSCPEETLYAFEASMPAFVHVVAIEGKVSLSAARNMLLRQLAARELIGPDALVAFPDDDCWYVSGFLAGVAALFARDSTLDFWFCRYASQPSYVSVSLDAPTPACTADIVRNASSNTMFLRGRVVIQIGEFDETLGVGTPIGGAEDVDYALRACHSARKVCYRNAALVGHRDKSLRLRTRYYQSGLLVLARYARQGTGWEYLRKIAVGIYLVLRRELPLAALASAMHRSLLECRMVARQARPFRKDQ